jgi:hypothetical protein
MWVLLTALPSTAQFSRRSEVLPGVWWLPLSEMQVRRAHVTVANAQGIPAPSTRVLAPGDAVRVIRIKGTRALIVPQVPLGDEEYWMDLDNLEPRRSCLTDARRQLDFILMHSGLVSLIDPERDSRSISDKPHPYSGFDGHFVHFTHTYNSLINALKRYDTKTAALLYYYGESAVCAMVLSRKGIEAYSVSAITRAAFEGQIVQYISSLVPDELLRSRKPVELVAMSNNRVISPNSVDRAALSAILLAPNVLVKLQSYQNLIIVPYGSISLFP